MAKEYKLEVEKRDSTKKSDLKKYRKEGKIPGIYYSYDSKKSINFLVTQAEINAALKSDANIFSINVGGENKNVLFKSNDFVIETDEVIFNRIEETAVSETKSTFTSNNTKINSEGFNIYDNGKKIKFYGNSVIILKWNFFFIF